MQTGELIPHLFRTEYTKIITVLVKVFGIEHIETAEDIVSETFLMAAETWGQKGLPKNPTAWLYTVSKNKTIDHFKRLRVFSEKIAPELAKTESEVNEYDIDLSNKNIHDSQLQMMFAICHPSIPVEAQISLSLNILCGFGAEEIADALLTTKEATYKRLARAKEKLRQEKVMIELPVNAEIDKRLTTVLTTIYLLFSEGYYSISQNTTLRRDFCVEAMRLNVLLINNEQTNTPQANALLSLMCFHASRFDARTSLDGEIILYHDQDEALWNKELIAKGEHYLNMASEGKAISKYHLEAAIAFWHTHKQDSSEKWENILQLYNKLLQIEYSPIAALNRTYALSKANGKEVAIIEAEKLNLSGNHFYFSLLGNLYTGLDNRKALNHYEMALTLANSRTDQMTITKNIERLSLENKAAS